MSVKVLTFALFKCFFDFWCYLCQHLLCLEQIIYVECILTNLLLPHISMWVSKCESYWSKIALRTHCCLCFLLGFLLLLFFFSVISWLHNSSDFKILLRMQLRAQYFMCMSEWLDSMVCQTFLHCPHDKVVWMPPIAGAEMKTLLQL